MNVEPLLPIGSLSEVTGVAITTLRYYDEFGLISPSARVGGKRRFGPETTGRVNFVRRAQRAGFSLEQIRSLLDDETEDWERVVADRLDDLRAQRDELEHTISILEELQHCGCASVVTCPRAPELAPLSTP